MSPLGFNLVHVLVSIKSESERATKRERAALPLCWNGIVRLGSYRTRLEGIRVVDRDVVVGLTTEQEERRVIGHDRVPHQRRRRLSKRRDFLPLPRGNHPSEREQSMS